MSPGEIGRKESLLTTLLTQMDVPKLRMDTRVDSNLRWLLRNLQIQNRDHPMLNTSTEIAKWLLTEKKNGYNNRPHPS